MMRTLAAMTPMQMAFQTVKKSMIPPYGRSVSMNGCGTPLSV